MARVELVDEVAQDFDRILQHLIEHGVDQPYQRIDEILQGCALLAQHPQIGRPVVGPTGRALRELVIGEGSHGYLALYEYRAALDLVLVVALRAQRELQYAPRA